LYGGKVLRFDSVDEALARRFEDGIKDEKPKLLALIKEDIKRAKVAGETIPEAYDCPTLLRLLEAVDKV
jgi:hypothetical protein